MGGYGERALDSQAAVEQPIRYEILGLLRAWQGSVELDLGPTKQRAVLAILLLNANRSTSIAQIVDAVWGDEPPENGPNVVQKYVGGLRRIVDPEHSPRGPGQLIDRTDAGYRISVDPASLDVEVFRGLVRDAHAARTDGDPGNARRLLLRADGLWRGEPLAGLAGPVFEAARTQLAEDRAAVLETWAELEVRHGELAQAVPTLLRLVAEYPLREQLRYLLIMALYRSGRQAEALAAYREARDFLAHEFGVEPGQRLQDLHRRMLRADPSLAPIRPVTAPPAPPRAAPSSPAPPAFQPAIPQFPPPGPQPTALPMGFATAIGGPHQPPPSYQQRPFIWPTHVERLSGWQIFLQIVGVVTPIVTLGFATWAVVGVYAVVRRSVVNGLLAVGYLGLVALIFMTDLGTTTFIADVAALAMLVTTVGGSAHATALGWSRWLRERDQRMRRETARAIFAYSPSLARQMRIGRPDLPGVIYDGGLLDVNTAPDWLIANLPGVKPAEATGIVDARRRHGMLLSPEHLFASAPLSWKAIRVVRDCLIFAPTPPPPAAWLRPENIEGVPLPVAPVGPTDD